MASPGEWKVPAGVQPKPADYDYDLEHALSAVVGLHAMIPPDAFTTESLGIERMGNGVLIRNDGLVLTIGYLVTEAESVWINLADGRSVQGHVLAYDQETGFGLVQALARVDLPCLSLGNSSAVQVGDPVVLGGFGGRARSVAARIISKQEFAGYWEYLLEEAIFTAPEHPNWGGAALIGTQGELLGIGSLQLQQGGEGEGQHLNMVVPIDLLKPIFDDLLTVGRPNRPARPWLGLYATELDGHIAVAGVAGRGPAKSADLQMGDLVVAVAGKPVRSLAGMFRTVWSLGSAGVTVPLRVHRDGRTFDVNVVSADRRQFLKAPRLH